MLWRRNRRSARQQTTEYANQADFKKIFSEDMAGLHLLAYLLTADYKLAEEVFVAGLEDTINGNPVFRQWARSWSQRAIIKRAIKVVLPSPNVARTGVDGVRSKTGNRQLDALIEGVAGLATFHRFVFVLSVLEGYSIAECATLLACTIPDVITARSEALQQLAANLDVEPAMPQSPVAFWKSIFTSSQASPNSET